MRITGSMKSAVTCTGILIAFLYGSVFAVNGIAVSVKGPGESSENLQGAINRLDIENSKVVKDTIIYSGANGCARLACISQDGKKVCFFRMTDKLVNGGIQSGSGSAYLSVIDINGANLKDVVTFTGTAAVYHYQYEQGGPDRSNDWPAGDWIYYHKPTTTELWRVNSTSLVNEKVLSWANSAPYVGRWSLSADGTRVNHNHVMCAFPGMTNCASNGDGAYGCNHCLSASGRFFSGWLIGFDNGTTQQPPTQTLYPTTNGQAYQGRYLGVDGHSYFEYLDWNWTTGGTVKFGISDNDFFNYRHVSYMLGTQFLQQAIGNPMIGKWSEYPRWASNSDKWILHTPDKQQLLWNWVDREAILAGRNSVIPYPGNANDAGDFWVRPPDPSYAGTRYEDITGAWLPLGTASTAALPDYIRCPGSSNDYECALKYGSLVIMPQSVYATIAKGQTPTTDGPNAAQYAVLVPDINTVVVQKSSSIQVTVTNAYYDPIDPVFGQPAPPVSWALVPQGSQATNATLSSSSGLTTTINTTASFGACSVQVSITVGATTKTARKLVATQAVEVSGSPGPARAFEALSGVKISLLDKGSVTLSMPAGVRSVEVFRADGTRILSVAAQSRTAVIPARSLSPGMYLFRLNRNDGGSACVRWMAR